MIRAMDVIETRKRRRVVVDHRELARAIGGASARPASPPG
jgi:hypothetical protein